MKHLVITGFELCRRDVLVEILDTASTRSPAVNNMPGVLRILYFM